jgi:hypothetical protein
MRFKHIARPLSRILGRGPPKDPPVPTNPLAALDSGSPELIASTALGDGEEALRAAAIRKLEYGESLKMLAGLSAGASSAVPANLVRIAQQRVAQLIDAGSVDFAELCAPTVNVPGVLSVAGYSSNLDHLPRALALVGDPRKVARLVLEGSSSRLRQLAAQSISDPAELRQLLRQLRGKDKSVYKVIKQKCEALRTEERQIAQTEHDTIAACESLERHSHRVYEVIYEPSFRHFSSRWQALEAQASPEIRERATRAINRCQEIIAEHHRQLGQRAAEESEQAARRAAREHAVAESELETQRRSEAAALAAAEAAALRETEEKIRAEKIAAEALALRQISGLIGKAQGALREGNTGRASGLRRAIEEKLPTLPLMPAHLTRQIHMLDAKLQELKEWKEHAVAPKRAELIAEMEALIGSSEEPQALADRIKQLQEDWKTISKGVVSDSDADWQRFHQASQNAFQPCRDYFEAQAKLRQTNVERRRAVLERLRVFESAQSGERPEWRAVAAALREAPQEWRRHSPVDRAAGRALQEEFDASIGRLQGRLDAWHAQNAADKKLIIQRARELLTLEDGREAAEATKRLQLEWREVGPVQREQEQRLWEEFREHCDAVFQKRQQAYVDYTASLQANKARAAALCEEAERAGALSGPALREAAGKAFEWGSAFEALGEMPRAEGRALHDRFTRALKRLETALSQQRAREKAQSYTDLLEAAGRIQSYGWAVAQNATPADREALKQAAESFIGAVPQWPKGGAEALKEAWAKADAAAGLDAAPHETALRMLCIRSEILADVPTPPEDQPLRRDYQMRRLVQRMGQQIETPADEFDGLALEWVRVGPIPASTREPLLARFLRSHGKQNAGS